MFATVGFGDTNTRRRRETDLRPLREKRPQIQISFAKKTIGGLENSCQEKIDSLKEDDDLLDRAAQFLHLPSEDDPQSVSYPYHFVWFVWRKNWSFALEKLYTRAIDGNPTPLGSAHEATCTTQPDGRARARVGWPRWPSTLHCGFARKNKCGSPRRNCRKAK